MITDLVQETIEKEREEFIYKCSNCYYHARQEYQNGYFCCGVLEHTRNNIPFDTIRFCERIKGRENITASMAPDEAVAQASMLTNAVNVWMMSNKKYQKFRKIK